MSWIALAGISLISLFSYLGWFIPCGIFLLMGILALRYGTMSVTEKHYAIFNLFGKRWRTRKEGLTWRIPYYEKFQLYSKEVQLAEVDTTAKSKDLLGIILRGSVGFVPDPELLYKYDEVKNKLETSLVDSIKDELGVLAGTKDARDFVLQRKAITLMINCLLRLEEMPHKNPGQFGDTRTEIQLNDRLDFYLIYADKIKDLLDHEGEKPEERSRIEKEHGIDIKFFNLTNPDYTPNTNAAFEEAKQAEAKVAAAQSELKLVKDFQGVGASPQEAIDAAQVSIGKGTRQVHSIQGKPFEINIGGSR